MLAHLPPNYRKAEGYQEKLDAPSCFNCMFLRVHQGRYACNRYLAYILTNYVCDDWQNRPRTSWTKKLEPNMDDLKMIERHGIRDLQKGFSAEEG